MTRLALPALLAAMLAAAGCQTLDQITDLGTSVAVATGAITTNQAQSITRTATAVGKTFDTITPEQEYWVGRTVAATLLSVNRPYDNDAATLYLNTMCQYLAMSSDRPETFGGYHVVVMDSSDINAFAAPGGFILLSRGMLRCCRTEDAVAAVLAHEIGHVALKHGLKSIDKSRMTGALTTVLTEAGKNLGGKELAEVTQAFEGSITDITTTLANSGYSRQFESQADKAAVAILNAAGYDPRALSAMLGEMASRLKPGGHDFAKTHPDPKARIKEVNALIGSAPSPAVTPARQTRFEKALRGI